MAIAVVIIGYFAFSYLGKKSDGIAGNVADNLADSTPTETRSATSTPIPTPEPTLAADFAPIHLEGSGNGVPRFTTPDGAAALAQITGSAPGNFAVWAIAADGTENDLLVNVIGHYAGTVLFDETDGVHTVALRVEADGPWSIDIKPVSTAYVWDGATPLVGKGDDVAVLRPASSGLTTVSITHDGESNFAVYAYSSSNGIDLLVNEIGAYNGESLLADGTFLFEISADGNWTVSPPA